MSEIRFDGRVAIVTGAGGGLGRAHALLLASRGAKVVVNDLGGGRDGTGAPSSEMANKVVEEIKAAGGEGVADAHGVDTTDGGEAILLPAPVFRATAPFITSRRRTGIRSLRST